MVPIIKLVTILLVMNVLFASAQDSLSYHRLEEIEIRSKRQNDIQRLPEYSGTNLWSGKKNEVISLGAVNANITERTGRQVFAKVPGVFVYDMDGSGNQLNISTRGLDPHRGWEFNIRRNGAMTNSDIYGYPASHYNIPLEAVERIELVRGTGSLQYGAQFGGMLNYITKTPDATQRFGIEGISSLGSYGLSSNYLSVSGKIRKLQYVAYYAKRVSDGYRDNSESTYDAQSFQLTYTPLSVVRVTFELSRSNYRYRIPGPLTDVQFKENPRQSTRTRNYYSPEIVVPSFALEWKVGKGASVSWITSAVLGYRRSVMFDRPADVPDVIDPITNKFAHRQVDIDNYNSYTSELRFLSPFQLRSLTGKLVAGVQYMNNVLHRQQMGKGTTGSNYDLSVEGAAFGRDLNLKSGNLAFFMESKLQIDKSFSITPGFRFENGKSDMTGKIVYYNPEEIPNTITHRFPLLGLNAEYSMNGKQLYAGWSQAYRPVIFKDIIPASLMERSDKNLKDAFGYNLEMGYRGNTRFLSWDLSIFHLQYNNRLGTQAMIDQNNQFYLFRTNIGNSATSGVEFFGEYKAPISKHLGFSLFTSSAFFNGRYTRAVIRTGETNTAISGNKLESVPSVITRNGVSLYTSFGSFSLLYSYVGQTFSDALNTNMPSANGAVGLVPGYGLIDFNSTLTYGNFTFRVNVNNIMNHAYFTKRPSFYPGPGIWPSDGRSLVISVGFRA